METDFQNAANKINKSKHALIVSHRQPDGDTMGSNLALQKALSLYFGITASSVCADPLPFSLKFLPGSENVHKSLPDNFDLIISVDCSSLDQIKYPEIKPDINIDHHASNKKYGKINLVDSDAASTTVIVYKLLKYLQIPILPGMATNLLAGIYCDTGCFMHTNTTSDIYEIAADLMACGASANEIVKHMFKTKTVEQLKLWGKVLENIKVNQKGTIVSKITSDEFEETHATPKDLSGVINYLNSVPNCKMSMLLSEDMKGNVQGSIRTNEGGVDASELSGKLGGGGHKKAAGFTIPGKIVAEEVWRIED
ncbi:bifunctional oligoribonuclease/PAP phosphatase NrnA [Patescibacteria group bacterium]